MLRTSGRMMQRRVPFSLNIRGRGRIAPIRFASTISYDWDKIGHLADSSVLASSGDTTVHAAFTYAPLESSSSDLSVALKVDYRDRQYAHRRIPQNKSRRERVGSENEILTARIIDRAARPLFPKGLRVTPQLTLTAHAVDGLHDPVSLAVNAVSTALLTSSVPWGRPALLAPNQQLWTPSDVMPVGCVRVGLINGQIVVDPPVSALDGCPLDMTYAGTEHGCLMLEITANEVSTEVMAMAMATAHDGVLSRIAEQKQALHMRERKMQEQSNLTAISAKVGAWGVSYSMPKESMLVSPY